MVNRRDESLILYLYGEHDAPERVERELAEDPELTRRYEILRRELAALDGLVPPEPRPGLEARMWARLEQTVTQSRRRPALRFAAGMVGLVAASRGHRAGRVHGGRAQRARRQRRPWRSLRQLPSPPAPRVRAALADTRS